MKKRIHHILVPGTENGHEKLNTWGCSDHKLFEEIYFKCPSCEISLLEVLYSSKRVRTHKKLDLWDSHSVHRNTWVCTFHVCHHIVSPFIDAGITVVDFWFSWRDSNCRLCWIYLSTRHLICCWLLTWVHL